MNILQIMGCTSNQYASMEYYLIEKAKYLREKECQLIVVYENIPQSKNFINDFSSNGGILKQEKMHSFWDLRYVLKILSIIKKNDIDVIHSYFTPTCHFIAIWLLLCKYRKIVRTAANMPYGNIGHPPFKVRFRRRTLESLYRAIMCRSNAVKDAFTKVGVPNSKLFISDGGCNTEKYFYNEKIRKQYRNKLKIDDNTLVLGTCSRLVSVKRIDRLINFSSNALKKGYNIKLLIAGDGPLKEQLNEQIKTLNCENDIILLGHQSNLRQVYCSFDIFCLASESEGMSNSILEAMACERPVIVSNILPNRDIVNKNTGYLINYDSCEDFESSLQQLSNKEERLKIGRYNRQRIIENFSINSRLEKEFKVYTKVLKV